LLAELKSRKKDRGMDFYVPNPIQQKAHQSKARTICFVAGNRAGKTTAGAMEVAWHVTKKYPDWYPKERRFDRPVKIRIATDRFFKIDTVIEPKLQAFMPKGEILRIKRSPQGYVTKLTTKDGSFIEFLTMEQDQMAFEGQDLDLFWGDEPVNRAKYIATQRGLVDRGGFTFLTFTPLVEPWMKEEIVDRADGKEIDVFTADIRDNKFDTLGNTILKEEDIKRWEDTLTEEEKETRLHGRFFHLRGMVYKEFSDVHLIDKFKYEEGYPVICVLDPHDRQPHWVIWAMVDRIDDIFVMYESQIHCSTKELAARIMATERYFSWNMVKRLIDPNFGRRPSTFGSNINLIDELANYNCRFIEANDDKDNGHMKVKDMLHYSKDRPLDINNKPKLYFVRDMVPKTIHSMRNLQHDEWKGSQDKDPKEEIKQKDTHGADCVRYLCADSPSYDRGGVYEQILYENPY